MSDKIFDLFYYFIPGSFWVAVNLLIFKQYFTSQLPKDVDPLIVFALLFIISIVAGLFIEFFSWLILRDSVKGRYEEQYGGQDLIRKINRKLYLENKRTLPEHYSGRAEFFRNMVVVGWSFIASYLIHYFCITKNELDFLGALGCILFASLSLHIYHKYAKQEVAILYNYHNDAY